MGSGDHKACRVRGLSDQLTSESHMGVANRYERHECNSEAKVWVMIMVTLVYFFFLSLVSHL